MNDVVRSGALGIIEVTGSARATLAADSILKAASVVLVSRICIGGGRVALSLRGDIASVQLALEAGADAVRAAGGEASIVCLGRPLAEIDAMVEPAAGQRHPPQPPEQRVADSPKSPSRSDAADGADRTKSTSASALDERAASTRRRATAGGKAPLARRRASKSS